MKQTGFKPKPCACGGMHSSLSCMLKYRRPLKKEAPSTKSKRTMTNREWFEKHPPSPKGTWTCYLQITPECPVLLTRSTITLEHVRSKARHPELKYDDTNLRPSCGFCNRRKLSLDLEDLVDEFPHLKKYIKLDKI